ncbi:MAG: hypothetical protein ACE5KZ_05015 [Candidatus Scalinduaceae bacterium]
MSGSNKEIIYVNIKTLEYLYYGAMATFDKKRKAELFSLRKNDVVEIVGTLNLSVSSRPMIEGAKFRLVKAIKD